MIVVVVILMFEICIDSVKINNNMTDYSKKELVEKLFYVLGHSHSTCFWTSKQSNDLFTLIIKRCFDNQIDITVEPNGPDNLGICNAFVFLSTSSTVCHLFLNTSLAYLTFDYKIIIIISSLSVELVEVENCSSKFDSASVTVISLQPQFLVLSSLLTSPRKFLLTDDVLMIRQPPNKLHSRLINVATYHFPPFIEITHNRLSVEYSGMEMGLWKDISRYLNLTWNVVKLDRGPEWGVPHPENGTWMGGIPQALRDGVTDIAFCNIWQQHDLHAESMDFGPVMDEISLTFIVHRPYQIKDRWQNLFAVLQKEVWLTTLVALLFISLVHWCTCKLDGPASSQKTSLTESLLLMFGILMVAAPRVRAVSTLVRLVVVWWFFFTLLLTTAITSTIVTRLTFPLYSSRINSFRQLVEGDFYWTSSYYNNKVKGLYFDFNNNWQNTFETKYRNITPNQLKQAIGTDDKLVLTAQRFGNKFVVVKNSGVDNNTDLSKFRVMRCSSRTVFTSFAFRKRSPYNELFTRTIQRFIDNGIWSYWKSKTYQNARKELLIEKDIILVRQPEKLTMKKMYPVFLLLVFGNIMVCLVFIVEYFY